MTASADAAIRHWSEMVRGKTDKGPLRCSNIKVHGDILYSYGTHFELARPLRDKRGRIIGYLLNGDTYSVHTTQHQSSVRNVMNKTPEIPAVIIPHEALEGAGIDKATVKIIDVSRDRSEVRKHHTTTFPEGARWHEVDVHERREYTDAELLQHMGENWFTRYKEGKAHLQPWNTYRNVKVGTRRVLHTGLAQWSPEITVTTAADGSTSYDWETRHHWLGESLIRAKVMWYDKDYARHYRWATFLSGFDHQETVPLYFLCELPRGAKPRTVAEAYEVLKPEPVLMAEQMGRQWSRQGDIFAVPTRLDRKALKAMGARIEKRWTPIDNNDGIQRGRHAYILNTNHTATEVAFLPDGVTLARGLLYHDPQERQPDHARRKMGDGKAWHVVVKNTVPTTKRR